MKVLATVQDEKRPKTYDDDGNLVAVGAEADDAFAAHLTHVQEHNKQVLARLKPHELARLEAWLRTRTHATPPLRPTTVSGLSNGRAPREARNERRRGSRRGERSSSSSSDDPDPEPSARPCACGCGLPRRRDDYYAAEECRRRHARDRKAAERARKRALDAVERPGVDRHRPDPYLKFGPFELDALLERAKAGCRCNGSHIADGAGGCSKCGHWLAGARYSVSFIRARSAETRRVRKAVA